MPNGQGAAAGGSKLPLPIRGIRPPSNMSTPGQSRRRSPSSTEATTANPTTAPNRSSSHPPRADTQPQAPARTPARDPLRASAPPSHGPHYSIRTPGSQVLPSDFRASRQRPFHPASSAGRSKGGAGYALPTQFTPHGRAAIRALDTRRAAIDQINTPGRNRRRRSVRDQRETPRDVLRALSKTLAPKSKPVTTSTSSSSPDDGHGAGGGARRGRPRGPQSGRRKGARAAMAIPEDPDDSDEFPIDRPRFSLPIDEDADSDGDLPRPPRSSGLEDLDDNFTMQSIEMPRRATLGQQRLSMRMSDYGALGDPRSDNDDGVGIDSAFFPRADWADDTLDATGAGEEDSGATLERLDDEEAAAARRETMGGRFSDFGAIDFDLDANDQSTIMLAPQMMQSSPERQSFSPENEPFAVGFEEDDDGQPPFGEDEEPSRSGDNMEGVDDSTHKMELDAGSEDEEDDGNEVTEAGGDTSIAGGVAAESILARQMAADRSATAGRVPKRPGKKVSRHGIQYPSLPISVIKRLAQRFAGKTKLSADTMSAIAQASDWFFEQLGDDLQAYAHHAKGRTTINESDMLTLMRRYVS